MGKTAKKEEIEIEKDKNEEIVNLGEVVLDGSKSKKIQLLSIIGEIEGHEIISNSKTEMDAMQHTLRVAQHPCRT